LTEAFTRVLPRCPATGWTLAGPCLLGLMILTLAGCANDPDSELGQKDLALVCEFKKCDCAPDSSPFAKGEGLQWNLDGSAFCRAGFHLRLLEKPKSQKMTT
jgi:hypothetical protein